MDDRNDVDSYGGDIVVKIYVKRGQVPDLDVHERKIKRIRKTLLENPEKDSIVHVWPFQRAIETERAVYLMRQYCHSTLYDRLMQRPFLSFIEKKWICYQLLLALRFTHERNVTHGDVKCENVLMTSANWIFLSDFASFKPRTVPADNPADFTFYFDAGGRRRCYLAPERFVDSGNSNNSNNAVVGAKLATTQQRNNNSNNNNNNSNSNNNDNSEDSEEVNNEYETTREMDVFALGCVIGELFTDGTATFDLAQALAYRNENEEYEPDEFIANNLSKSVPDAKARDEILQLVLAMIHRTPFERPSVEEIFNSCVASGFFPDYFEALHRMGSDIININATADNAIEYLKRELPDLVKKIRKVEERLPASKAKGGSPGIRILAQYVCLNIRACKIQSSRVDGFSLLEKHIGKYCDDQTRIDLIVPRCVETIKENEEGEHDENDAIVIVNYTNKIPSTSRVKAAAIRTLDATLSRAQDLQKSDAKLFQDYVWPALRKLAGSSSNDANENQSEYAKVALAESLSSFCQNAFRFSVQRSASGCKEVVTDEDQATLAEAFTKLTTAKSGTMFSEEEDEMGGGGSSTNVLDDSDGTTYINDKKKNEKAILGDFSNNDVGMDGFNKGSKKNNSGKKKALANNSFDAFIQAHRKETRQIILEIFANVNTFPNASIALLENIGEIAKFFGRRETTSFLLPLLVTCMNASEWRTRYAFLSNITSVAIECGASVTESFVVPCAERCLTDITDDVVNAALKCLLNLVQTELTGNDQNPSISLDLRTSIIVGACSKAAPLMCHPIQSIRDSAIHFFASSAKKLGSVDAFALLAPIAEPFLQNNRRGKDGGNNNMNETILLWIACPDVFQDAQSLRSALRDPPSNAAYDSAVELLVKSNFVSAADLSNFANAVILESLSIDDSVQPLVPYILSTLEARRRRNARTIASQDAEKIKLSKGGLKLSSASVLLSSFHKPLVTPVKPIPISESLQEQSRSGGGDSLAKPSATGRNISSSASWVPRGVLLAHLKEHKSAVNHLATAPTNANVPFFVSCSDDGSCKIWDSRRLERDVSFRSRLTYASQGGKIKTACVLSENRVCSGSDRGSVHVWRVDYVKAMRSSKNAGEDAADGRRRVFSGAAEKYTGAAEIHTYDPSEGSVVSTLALSPNVVAFATQRGGCKIWDLRQSNKDGRSATVVALPWHPKRGVITSLANPNNEVLTSDFSSIPFASNGGNYNEDGFSSSPWFVLSTSTGEIELIDSRFMTSVARWKAPTQANVNKMRTSSSSRKATTNKKGRTSAFLDSISCMSVRAFLPPSSEAMKMMKPLVWCSHKKNEIALWDASTGECREVLRTLDTNLSGVELEAASKARPNVLATGTSLRKQDSDWRLNDPFLRQKKSNNFSGGKYRRIVAKDGQNSIEGNDDDDEKEVEEEVYDDDNLNHEEDDDDENDAIDDTSFRSLLSLPSGALISGGSDCTIRMWFPGDSSKSRIISGPPRASTNRPRYVETRLESTSRLVRVGEAKQRPTFIRIQQETSPYQSSSSKNRRLGSAAAVNDPSNARENSMASRNEGHHDAITALATVPSYSSSSSSSSSSGGNGGSVTDDAFRGGRMLLSASRDGIIKAWK